MSRWKGWRKNTNKMTLTLEAQKIGHLKECEGNATNGKFLNEAAFQGDVTEAGNSV